MKSAVSVALALLLWIIAAPLVSAEWIPEQPFGGEDDQRPPEQLFDLSPQHMEKLGRGGRVNDLHVLVTAKLQITFNAGAGMLRSLTFVAMRQKHGQGAAAIPLGQATGNKLIDDNLGAVGKITELGFPDGQIIWGLHRVAVLKAKYCKLGEHAVVD